MCNLLVQKRQSALRGCLHVESTIDSYGEVIDRFGLRLAVEPPSVLTSRLDTLSIRLGSSAPRFGPCLVHRPGQAWICVLDLERDRLRPSVDLADLCRRHCAGPERAEESVRTRCLEGARVRHLHFATRHIRAGVRIRGYSPVASDIRAFATVLSSTRHHQVLCLHACCLSVCLCLHVV